MAQNRKPPAYQEYAATILVATLDFRAMSLQARGLLYTMRLECWANQRLTSNQNTLARILGIQEDEVKNLLPAVMPFFEIDSESIICPELEDYRQHLAEQRRKQSQGGKTGSSITNSKRPRKLKNIVDDNPSTSSSILSSTSTSDSTSSSPCNSQVTYQVGIESSVQSSLVKLSQKQFSNKRNVDDSFVRDYEAAEQCTADDYFRATRGE